MTTIGAAGGERTHPRRRNGPTGKGRGGGGAGSDGAVGRGREERSEPEKGEKEIYAPERGDIKRCFVWTGISGEVARRWPWEGIRGDVDTLADFEVMWSGRPRGEQHRFVEVNIDASKDGRNSHTMFFFHFFLFQWQPPYKAKVLWKNSVQIISSR